MWLVIVLVNRELSQSEHILIEKRIQEPNISELGLNDGIVISAIELQEVKWNAKHEQSNKADHREVSYVIDGLFDQLSEERCWSEKLAPVQYFHPQEEGQ